MADKKLQYEGHFVPLVDTGDAKALTNDDLDAMVKNFKPKTISEHIPVRFGRANGDGPIVARVSALRRDGAVLSGKLIQVDPRFDQLLASRKLGGRTRRSMRFSRAPETGASLSGYGFLPPRVYSSAHGMEEAVEHTDAGLSKLAGADSGQVLQFSATDSGRVDFVVEDRPRRLRMESNSQKLSDIAKARAEESGLSFGEALTQCAKDHPELTRETGPAFAERSQQGEGWRLQRNSERLSDLAEQRAEEAGISFGEALSQVAAENKHLTLPDSVIVFAEDRPKSNGQRLTDLAYERARQKRISFGEALSHVAAKHPELTRG